MDLLSPRTSRVGIPTGPKGVGVEIRAEFGPGMACVERLFPGNDEPRQQGMVFEPASGCPPPRMTYSQAQAARVRKALAGRKQITEKEMFGGSAFLHGGKMLVGIAADDLILPIQPPTTETMSNES